MMTHTVCIFLKINDLIFFPGLDLFLHKSLRDNAFATGQNVKIKTTKHECIKYAWGGIKNE